VFAMVNLVMFRIGVLACCLYVVILPLFGYFTLRIIAALSPEHLALRGFWVTVLVGLIMSFVAIPSLRYRPGRVGRSWNDTESY